MENASTAKHTQMKVRPPEGNQCQLISGPQLQFQASAVFQEKLELIHQTVDCLHHTIHY
jgi:uncharacterized lipoprotein